MRNERYAHPPLLPMQPAQRTLIRFFEGIARGEHSRLRLLAGEQRFEVRNGRWTFTLPDLHAFLARHEDAIAGLDYKQFRKLIFATPINQTIKELGAEIVIVENLSNVDRSIYAMDCPAIRPASEEPPGQ